MKHHKHKLEVLANLLTALIAERCERKDIFVNAKIDLKIHIDPADSVLDVDPSGVPATGKVGSAFNGFIGVTGGTPPYDADVTAGALPDGLQLSGDSSGVNLSGTPTTEGDFDAEVDVFDNAVPPAVSSVRLRAKVKPSNRR